MAGVAWIVTHPETAMDREGRLHGNLDGPLDAEGKTQVTAIAKTFAGKPVKRIFSSPKQRAVETARSISKVTGAPVHITPQLKPWDAGNLSGQKVAKVKGLLDHFSSHPEAKPRDGEPKQAFLDRFKSFASKLRPGDVVSGHSQHALAWNYAKNGGDAAKVPMVSGKSGEVKAVSVGKSNVGMALSSLAGVANA